MSTPEIPEIKVVGKSGQISLGKRYAGKMLRLDRRADGSMLLTAVTAIPESQLWVWREPDRSRMQRGIEWAAKHPRQETDLAELEARLKRHWRRRGY